MSAHTHAFPNWAFPDAVNTAVYATARVAHQGFPVLQVSHDEDGDWQFLDASSDELGECVLLCLGCVVERDPTLTEISDLPRGWGAFRPEPEASWERWENEPETDEADNDTGACACDVDENANEQRALADIATYGLHVINVAEQGELPPFSYSLGIERSLGLPELIVIGLRAEIAQAAINECYRQMKNGARIAPGVRVSDLLGGGFECLIGEVSPSYFNGYMGWARWLYKGNGFRAWQIVFPSTSGVFPWEAEASDWFRRWQPLLSAPAPEPGESS